MSTSIDECPDSFHDGEHDGEEYVFTDPDSRWQGTGFRCSTCGFQTVTTETFVPEYRPCPACGKVFDAMPDVPGEVCQECFEAGLAARIAELAEQHKLR